MATVADLGVRVLRSLGIAAVPADERPALVDIVPYDKIATRALQALGVAGDTDTLYETDLNIAIDKLAAINEGLIAAGIASWLTTAIPRAVAEEYVSLAALHLAPVFGRTADPKAIPVLEDRIRRASLLARAPGIAEQAIMDVHAGLDARGLTRWTLFDIPDYVEWAYVALASVLVAPQFMPTFPVQIDPNAEARANRQIAQVVALPSGGETLRPEWF